MGISFEIGPAPQNHVISTYFVLDGYRRHGELGSIARNICIPLGLHTGARDLQFVQ